MNQDSLGLNVGIVENSDMGEQSPSPPTHMLHVRADRRHYSYLPYVLSRVGAASTSAPNEIGLMIAVARSYTMFFLRLSIVSRESLGSRTSLSFSFWYPAIKASTFS